MSRGAFAAATAIALTVGGGLTPLARTAAAEEPVPSETVVPATPGQRVMNARLHLQGESRWLRADAIGTEGVFHTQDGYEGVLWTRFSDGRSTPVPLPTEAGTTVYGTGTDTLALRREGEVELRDPDGTTRRITLPATYQSYSVFGSTVVAYERLQQPDGTYATGPMHLLSLQADGTQRDLTVSGPEDGTPLGTVLAGDGTGLLAATKLQGDERRVGVVSAETGRVEALTPPVPKSFRLGKISPEYIALYNGDAADKTVLVTSRTAPSTPFTSIALNNYDGSTSSNGNFAIVGDWLVYKTVRNALEAVPIAGGPAVTLLPRVAGGPSAGPDGTAAVIGGSDSVDWAVRHITADASGKPVVTVAKRLPKPAPVQSIALAQGRLSVVDNSGGSSFEWVRDIGATAPLGFGARAKLTGIVMSSCAASDTACAEYRALGDGRFMRRVGTVDQSWRYYVNGPGYSFTEVYLPVGSRIDDISTDYLVSTAPGTSGAPGTQTVRPIGGGVVAERAPVASALWNTWLWSATGTKGAVAAQDLKTGKAVESADTGAPCVPQELQATGRWLYWSCGADGPAGVYDRTEKTSRAVPSGESLLGDGYVVTHDKAAGTLVLTGAAATAPAGRVVGDLPDTGVSQRHVRWTVDRFGGALAYVDVEEQVHLVPTGIAAQPLDVLERTASDTIRASTSGVSLFRMRFSRPAASWTLTARHAVTGRVSELGRGADVRGPLRFFWNGRDTAGELLPNGSYAWTLTAEPADGSGPTLRQTGQVLLSGGQSSATGGFRPVTSGSIDRSTRIMDTRGGVGVRKGKVGAGGTVTLQVTGRADVPLTGVTSVALNVTAVNATASTYVSAYPAGTARPAASNLNVPVGRAVANLVVVPVKDGKVTFYNRAGSVDLIADVAGYYTTQEALLFQPLKPTRVVDTRTGLGIRKGKLLGTHPEALDIAGRAGVPATGFTTVVLQVTATNATSPTFVSVYGNRYIDTWTGSHVNVAPGQTASNTVVVPIYSELNFYTPRGATDLIVDVVGYYAYDIPGSLFEPLAPARSLDTRTGTGAPKAKVGPGRTVTLNVAGRNGVPATGVTAVVLNLTATGGTRDTVVTAYPYGTSRPGTSNLNVPAGRTASVLAVVPVKDGKVTLYNHAGSVDLIADVQGFYAP
ncbi:hypothetical protein [Streptomyces sp. NPDC094032]|uniref:hypothetical protein n=1 Tax=Streptomyces sp. NPDC094032 TaxID=3155308 RepID=UPI00332C29DB